MNVLGRGVPVVRLRAHGFFAVVVPGRVAMAFAPN
jgi:hypothetical protein